jgi:hypothetical protein
MKNKGNKKTSDKVPKSDDDLLAEAMIRLRHKKVLFPKQLESARKYVRNIRNAKFEGL